MTRAVLDTGDHGITLELEYGTIVDAETGAAVTANTTLVRFSNLEAWIDANGYDFYDTSNQLKVTGGWVTDTTYGTINIGSSSNTVSGQFKLKELPKQQRTIAYGSSPNYAVELELVGINAAGQTLSGAKTFSQPRRPYHAFTVAPVVTLTTDGVATIPANQTDPAADLYVATTDWLWETDGVLANYALAQANTVLSKTVTLSADHRYRMAVRRSNQDSNSSYGYSDYLHTTPAAPSGLTGVRGTVKTTVDLAWTNNARYVSGYIIERSVSGAAYSQIGTTTNLTFSDPSLPLGTTANYRVMVQSPTGVNAVLYSAYSNIANVDAGTVPPSPPTLVTLTLTSDVTAQIDLAGNQNNAVAPGYWESIGWEQAINGPTFAPGGSLPGPTTAIILSGLVANSRYQTRVRSVNVAGTSVWVPSGFIYTTPDAPSVLKATRGVTDITKVTLTWTLNAAWGANHIIERSVNAGASWVQLGNTNQTTFIDTLPHSSVAVYRVKTQSPVPVVESLWSNHSQVLATIVTDTSGIPGVSKIYNGPDRCRVVAVGAVAVWTDGEL